MTNAGSPSNFPQTSRFLMLTKRILASGNEIDHMLPFLTANLKRPNEVPASVDHITIIYYRYMCGTRGRRHKSRTSTAKISSSRKENLQIPKLRHSQSRIFHFKFIEQFTRYGVLSCLPLQGAFIHTKVEMAEE